MPVKIIIIMGKQVCSEKKPQESKYVLQTSTTMQKTPKTSELKLRKSLTV